MLRDPASLVMTLGEAVKWRNALRAAGKTLAVTNGCFDIMHRGHAEYLHQSRELAGALLVLINSDASVRALKGPARPIVPQEHRAYMLASLRAVDAVVVFDSSRCDTELAALAPDIYVKGGDYTPESLDPGERVALLAAGTEIVIKPFIPGFSTTDIIRRIKG